jgi:hypothetical protein
MLAVRIQLRDEPGGVAVRGEYLNDGLEVDRALLLVEGGTLGGSDELHGSIPVWVDPSGPFAD